MCRAGRTRPARPAASARRIVGGSARRQAQLILTTIQGFFSVVDASKDRKYLNKQKYYGQELCSLHLISEVSWPLLRVLTCA